MIRFITLLLLCQLAGEVITVAFQWPVPGPVAGMVILFGAVSYRPLLNRSFQAGEIVGNIFVTDIRATLSKVAEPIIR